ncbi:MAG: PHP domain-containing protein [Thermomicrobiales bacterium]
MGTPGRAYTVDLHTHSTASDGMLAPARLVALAVERGLRVLALTDHDTVGGVPEASAAAAATTTLRFIPGVELSTHVDAGEVHMLGYFIDPANQTLIDSLARFREAREGRAEGMVERLSAAGAPIRLERVLELAAGGSIGRPHVARALVEAGHAQSVGDAFDRWLVRGRPGYVERFKLTPADAVRLIREVGGVPVLAHPHSADDLPGLLPNCSRRASAAWNATTATTTTTAARNTSSSPAATTSFPPAAPTSTAPASPTAAPLAAPTSPECVEALEARKA